TRGQHRQFEHGRARAGPLGERTRVCRRQQRLRIAGPVGAHYLGDGGRLDRRAGRSPRADASCPRRRSAGPPVAGGDRRHRHPGARVRISGPGDTVTTAPTADAAIKHPDDDLLGLAPYARTLAQFVRGVAPPFTIGIYGEWGAGKATFASFLEDCLTADAVWTA